VTGLRVPGRTGGTFDGSYDNCPVLVHTDEDLSGITEGDSALFATETPRGRIKRELPDQG